jgi:hypothetical protein
MPDQSYYFVFLTLPTLHISQSNPIGLSVINKLTPLDGEYGTMGSSKTRYVE